MAPTKKDNDTEKNLPKKPSATAKTGFGDKRSQPNKSRFGTSPKSEGGSDKKSGYSDKSKLTRPNISSSKSNVAYGRNPGKRLDKSPEDSTSYEAVKPVIIRKPSITTANPNKEQGSFVNALRVKSPKVKHNENAFYATGKRKSSVARVWIIRGGKGEFSVNGRTIQSYFPRATHQLNILRPFAATETVGSFDVKCTVEGGGVSGQADAIKLGISRALVQYNPDLRSALRVYKLLTRDSRVVESKKYGKHKARRSTQFSKR